MITTKFQGKTIPQLGFGTMRLPTNADKSIDEAQTVEMVRYAMAHGVNYFDTAYPYHGGLSEVVIGRALKEFPRESWYLADKYPGHQISSAYDPAAIFEEQLKKCGVDYFDFYLLHNVYESSMEVYLDKRWGILDYFREQRRAGRIRHLGFSSHGSVQNLREFLEICGGDMEFCQIQLNWLDWSLQNAKEKVALLNDYAIPIWVMEPLRGGRLCKLSASDEAALKALRPDESVTAWSFRFLQSIPGVQMILSGMSDIAQMQENVQIFTQNQPLSADETDTLFSIAERMKDSVPCTACRYCTAECPMELDIPRLLATYSEIRILPTTNSVMYIEGLPAEKQPSACIACGKCAKMCPQSIDIPGAMKDFADRFAKIPKWTEICRQREEAARKLREK